MQAQCPRSLLPRSVTSGEALARVLSELRPQWSPKPLPCLFHSLLPCVLTLTPKVTLFPPPPTPTLSHPRSFLKAEVPPPPCSWKPMSSLLEQFLSQVFT